MAMAAKVVICETNEIVPVGMISPNDVITPGAIVTELISMPQRHH
jgi:acetate CoA/acetoacetate CoA-transferase alpha subunit